MVFSMDHDIYEFFIQVNKQLKFDLEEGDRTKIVCTAVLRAIDYTMGLTL